MSWLKDILEKNRRVVDSWPAWKKGEAMARKEELEKLARTLAGEHYECEDSWFNCPLSVEGCADPETNPVCTCGASNRRVQILNALQQVEREVWWKVIKEMEESGNGKLSGWIQWLKDQQKELG